MYGTEAPGRITRFLNKAADGIPMIMYGLAYLIFFHVLETIPRSHFTIIHSALDDMIPFSEVFIIPYIGWFAYVGYHAVMMYLQDRKSYHRLCTMLVIGMTIFLIVSAVWPNKLMLRPAVMPRNNVFSTMVRRLYATDTDTNVFPSIHVFNTLAIMTAVRNSHAEYVQKPLMRYGTYVFGVLIILSTMFLKQHSVIDVSMAFVMWYACRKFSEHYQFSSHAAMHEERV